MTIDHANGYAAGIRSAVRLVMHGRTDVRTKRGGTGRRDHYYRSAHEKTAPHRTANPGYPQAQRSIGRPPP